MPYAAAGYDNNRPFLPTGRKGRSSVLPAPFALYIPAIEDGSIVCGGPDSL